MVRQLLRKGLTDSLIQVAATTMVRLGLVVSLLILSGLLPLEEIGQFDLFIIGATFVQLAVTVGMDSGLAIVGQCKSIRMGRWYLVVSLIVACLLALSTLLAFELAIFLIPDLPVNHEMGRLSIGYGAMSGVMVLIFSWYRWQRRAKAASILLVVANVVGFTIAGLNFFLTGGIKNFVVGLFLGSVTGVVLSIYYICRQDGFGLRDFFKILGRKALSPIAMDLLKLSLPYFFASISLILRRTIDRAYILTLSDPKLIGAYAIVTRASEMIAFVLSIPSLGFTPIIISRHRDSHVQRFGSLIYTLYVLVAFILVLLTLITAPVYAAYISNKTIELMIPMMPSIIAGTLFIGENSISSFGYILARKSKIYSVLSAAFIVGYTFFIVVFSILGFGLFAVGFSFVLSSFLFSTVTVTCSERLFSFGYPLGRILMLKVCILMIAVWPMLSAGL